MITQEIVDTINQLVDSKIQLEDLSYDRKQRRQSLKNQERMISILNKIECHTNASRKYNYLICDLLYHTLKLKPNRHYNDESFVDWWKKIQSVYD